MLDNLNFKRGIYHSYIYIGYILICTLVGQLSFSPQFYIEIYHNSAVRLQHSFSCLLKKITSELNSISFYTDLTSILDALQRERLDDL